MPSGPARDIPHVRTHDHRITRPPTEERLLTERKFKGLISVNDPGTDALTMARGYLLEYESYHPDPDYLDSAWHYLEKTTDRSQDFHFNALVNYYFLRHEYGSITTLVEQTGIRVVLDSLLIEQEYSNYDAWTAYRIGQAWEGSGNALIAGYFYRKAVDLAPYMLDFQAKHGSILAIEGKLKEAEAVFQFILKEDARFSLAWVNMGYLLVRQKRLEEGEEAYRKALRLDPDNIQALLNLAALMQYRMEPEAAETFIDRVLELDPGNQQARQLRGKAGSLP